MIKKGKQYPNAQPLIDDICKPDCICYNCAKNCMRCDNCGNFNYVGDCNNFESMEKYEYRTKILPHITAFIILLLSTLLFIIVQFKLLE